MTDDMFATALLHGLPPKSKVRKYMAKAILSKCYYSGKPVKLE